jgi:hypothetical protein
MANVGMGKSTRPPVRRRGDIGNRVRNGPAVAADVEEEARRLEPEPRRERLKRPRAVGPDAALRRTCAIGPAVPVGPFSCPGWLTKIESQWGRASNEGSASRRFAVENRKLGADLA